MTGYELRDLLANNRELISDTWYYFLAVHLAVFGIVYIASRRIAVFDRTILLLAYFGFLFLNFRAQADNYANHNAILDQIKLLPAGSAGRALVTAERVWIVDFLPVLYLGAAAFAGIIILLTNNKGGRG